MYLSSVGEWEDHGLAAGLAGARGVMLFVRGGVRWLAEGVEVLRPTSVAPPSAIVLFYIT